MDLREYANQDFDRLANEMGASPGGAPPAPPTSSAPPAAQPPSLTDLYIKARSAGMDDTQASLALAQHLRERADLRSGVREAGAVAAGRPYDAVSDRAGLMAEANAPIADLQQRRAVEPLAFEETKHRAELAGNDVAMQQAAALRDPNHPANVMGRTILQKAGVNVPPNLVISMLPEAVQKQITPLLEANAQAPLRASEVEKNKAEAAKSRTLAGPEAEKTRAETQKLLAEAALAAGGKPIPPEVAQKITNQAEALQALDKLEALHSQIGASGYTPPGVHVGADGRYHDALKALGPAVAAGALPLGRETPGAVEEIIKSLPSGILPHDRAKAAIDTLRESIRSNASAQLEQLKAGHFSTAQAGQIASTIPDKPAAARPKVVKVSDTVKVVNGARYHKLPDGRWAEL
jgi:hypothetical protein